jgi:hypothetical protein
MEVLSSGSSLVLGSALAALSGAYINAKFGISNDLRTLYNERTFLKRFQQRVAELSPITSHYGMLQHAVDVQGLGNVEALWFEQKTWTYTQLKDCKCRELISSAIREMKVLTSLSGRPFCGPSLLKRYSDRRLCSSIHYQLTGDGSLYLCLSEIRRNSCSD